VFDAKDGGSFISDSMVSGSLPMIQGAGIALGEPLVRLMGLALGDPTILVFPTSTGSGIVPVVQRFQLVATFAVGADPDYQLAIIDIARIEELGITNAGTLGWRVTLADPLSIGSWSSPVDAPLSTWAEQFGELFRAIEIEKGIMFALLALVVGLAAFNMVSGQALLVNDKRGDIAILSTNKACPDTILNAASPTTSANNANMIPFSISIARNNSPNCSAQVLRGASTGDDQEPIERGSAKVTRQPNVPALVIPNSSIRAISIIAN
jgi:lipoprotein-releasing system permease protein